MSVDSVAPVALDKVAAAWAEAVASVDAEAQVHDAAEAPRAPGVDAPRPAGDAFVERILGHADSDVAAAPARPAGTHAENGPETANAQIFSRPQPPAPGPLHDADARLPTAPIAHGEFALPAALLVPATLIGLQVEPAASWPLARRGSEVSARGDGAASEGEDALADDDAQREADEQPPAARERPCREPGTAAAIEPPAAQVWCDALTRALSAALAAKIPPQALLFAAEQWRRGRCVVLACPQGADPAGPAWAFVLWPRALPTAAADRAGGVKSLALYGLRVEARLQWSSPPCDARWCHVRVVKEHHPKRGRQLIPVGAAGSSAPVPCEVQLGPVLARSLRWCEVCVHIDAAKRFWAALGAQWSAHVVVSSRPLVERAAREETAC
jgi:hypothetical protein